MSIAQYLTFRIRYEGRGEIKVYQTRMFEQSQIFEQLSNKKNTT